MHAVAFCTTLTTPTLTSLKQRFREIRECGQFKFWRWNSWKRYKRSLENVRCILENSAELIYFTFTTQAIY